ncbi:unnamed protein product [Moneuplotes crassus]|uniref:Protein tyrosine phosphatase n=1 Tax=Euplotes crassus TaxID=5936 RepID=A0AAD1UNS8_EUPCR|nr:unnamed protein product [Moneuplotes crassus]
MDSLDDDDDSSSSSSSSSSDDFNVFNDTITNNTAPQSVAGTEAFEDEHKQEKQEINAKYEHFPLIVEGPEFNKDHSFFLMHKNADIASLEKAILAEDFDKEREERLLDMEFRILNRVCHTMVHFQGLHREHNQEFKAQNRYNEVLPYKHNLVEVRDKDGNNIYVNGSYINIPIRNFGERAFIAASAPVEKSLNNFWEMIFQNKVPMIVMLCNIEEKSIVCEKYWDDETPNEFGEITVKPLSVTGEGEKIIKRVFEVSKESSDEILTVTQLHHTNWLDDHAPFSEEYQDIDLLMKYVSEYRSSHFTESESKRPDPILVHCSAGIGRTGTFIALHCLVEVLEAIKKGTYNNTWGELKGNDSGTDISEIVERFHDFEKPRFSPFGVTRRLKEQRFGMVKTQKQYEFLYSYMGHYLNKA